MLLHPPPRLVIHLLRPLRGGVPILSSRPHFPHEIAEPHGWALLPVAIIGHRRSPYGALRSWGDEVPEGGQPDGLGCHSVGERRRGEGVPRSALRWDVFCATAGRGDVSHSSPGSRVCLCLALRRLSMVIVMARSRRNNVIGMKPALVPGGALSSNPPHLK